MVRQWYLHAVFIRLYTQRIKALSRSWLSRLPLWVWATSLTKIWKAIASYRLLKQRSAFVWLANLLVSVNYTDLPLCVLLPVAACHRVHRDQHQGPLVRRRPTRTRPSGTGVLTVCRRWQSCTLRTTENCGVTEQPSPTPRSAGDIYVNWNYERSLSRLEILTADTARWHNYYQFYYCYAAVPNLALFLPLCWFVERCNCIASQMVCIIPVHAVVK